MSQTDAQKRAMKKYLSNPENRRKRTKKNYEYLQRKKHEKNIEHAKNIIALGNDIVAVTDYIENVLKHRKTRSDTPLRDVNSKSISTRQDISDENLEIFVNPITEEVASFNPQQSIETLTDDLFSKNDGLRKRITPIVHIDDGSGASTILEQRENEETGGNLSGLVQRASLTAEENIPRIDAWKDNGENGAHLLTMPNIPTPLQGPGMQPRTIFGSTNWDSIRKKCYADAKYHCQICGKSCIDGQLQCHEVFSIDYEKRTSTFERVVALCPRCHSGIHSGKALTLYKHGLISKRKLLAIVNDTFAIIYAYNKAHPLQEPLRLFESFLNYLKQEDLKLTMQMFIKKYDIKFYRINEMSWKRKYWSSWKLIIDGIEHPTIYKTREDWEKAMKEVNKVWAVDP